MIYLLGVDHRIQHDGPLGPRPEHTEAFINAVTKMIDELDIEILMEEYNEDAKRWDQVTQSVIEKIAYAKELEHIFCEPSLEERKANGILTETQIFKKLGFDNLTDLNVEQKALVDEEQIKHYAVREVLWYDTIKDDIESNMLCVIGASHISTFGNLLKKKGNDHKVLSENWCLENLS